MTGAPPTLHKRENKTQIHFLFCLKVTWKKTKMTARIPRNGRIKSGKYNSRKLYYGWW